MPEQLGLWLGWAGITLALFAFAYAINKLLDWIQRRIR